MIFFEDEELLDVSEHCIRQGHKTEREVFKEQINAEDALEKSSIRLYKSMKDGKIPLDICDKIIADLCIEGELDSLEEERKFKETYQKHYQRRN